MSLSIGIVGLPNVGKSTLFNALTNNNILAANYPFATIEPNTGIVLVPDERLNKLSLMYNGAPMKPAAVTFVDIAGLVAGASQGEGLGNQFLANIRTCQAICHVVRAFEDPDVQHVDSQYDSQKDIEVINTELVLADLQTVKKRLPLLQKEARANPKLNPQLDLLSKIDEILQENTLLDRANFLKKFSMTPEQKAYLTQLQLLTLKPVIYLFNVGEDDLQNSNKHKQLGSLVKPSLSLYVCAKFEQELNSLDAGDRQEMLDSYGASQSGLNQVIRNAYKVLGLQSFFTAGEKEVKAWTVPTGSTAPQAAGVIHNDFKQGFIAAQVVTYEDLIETGSLSAAKASGKVRTEGKDYIMNEGDVVEFRFNV